MAKKVIIWGGIAFLIFFIAYRPETATDVAGSLGGIVKDSLAGLWDFVTAPFK